jgi:hypothetical protein
MTDGVSSGEGPKPLRQGRGAGGVKSHVRERTADMTARAHPLQTVIASSLLSRRRTVTTRDTRLSIEAIPSIEDNSNLERRRLPISLCLAGTAVLMNILAAVLSLMALSVS